MVNVLSVLLAFSLDLTPGERALILALGLLVLAAELGNTAVEEILFEGRRAVGVRTAQGELRADAVVMNADFAHGSDA